MSSTIPRPASISSQTRSTPSRSMIQVSGKSLVPNLPLTTSRSASSKLVILDVGGYPIYYGNPVEAVVYFRDATRLVDKQSGSCPECGNVNAEQIFNIIENRKKISYTFYNSNHNKYK